MDTEFHGGESILMNWRLHGLNNEGDHQKSDQFSWSFNTLKKAGFYQLLKLVNPIPIHELDRVVSPLGQAKVRVYKKYLENERQDWRRPVYERVTPFYILLTEGDPNYAEIDTYMIYELWRELNSGQVEIPLAPLYPANWWNEKKQCRNQIQPTFQGKSTTNKVLPEIPEFPALKMRR